jgi:hypothetical protein
MARSASLTVEIWEIWQVYVDFQRCIWPIKSVAEYQFEADARRRCAELNISRNTAFDMFSNQTGAEVPSFSSSINEEANPTPRPPNVYEVYRKGEIK